MPPMLRRLGVPMAVALSICAVSNGMASAQQVAQANQVMAAFVYRLPQFVEWPADALEGSDALEICIAEPDPLSATLEHLLDGENLQDRPLAVRRLGRSRNLDGCHVLYVSADAYRPDTLLERAADRPILTVGDAPDFLDAGGIIQLMVLDRRIRFEVSSGAAARAGLQLSSQLMDLAVAVRGGPP